MYNFDETGFRIGAGRAFFVITRNQNRRHYISSYTNRESLTAIETISGSGSSIAPFLILKGQEFMEAMFKNALPGSTVLSLNDTGYSTDRIAYEYIKHFEKETRSRRQGVKRLLLFDNHVSHLSQQLLQHCNDNDIIPFALVPHSSHLCQPLDVGIFQTMKAKHGQILDEAARYVMCILCRFDFDSLIGAQLTISADQSSCSSITGFATLRCSRLSLNKPGQRPEYSHISQRLSTKR